MFRRVKVNVYNLAHAWRDDAGFLVPSFEGGGCGGDDVEAFRGGRGVGEAYFLGGGGSECEAGEVGDGGGCCEGRDAG